MGLDEKQWRAFRSGEKSALAGIAERHYHSLLRYGMKFGLDDAEIQDCIQDLFLDLWQNRERVADTPSVKNYLFKAVRNRIIDVIRQKQRFGPVQSEEWQVSFSDFCTVEKEWIEKEYLTEVSHQIRQQMEALPKREREALYLRYFENLSLQEVSEIMGVNRQSVANFVQKALQRMRGRLTIPLLVIFSLEYFFFNNRV
ncbi:sigma-70 family RNA polymerase sigma factor [Ravibacter arvi]|uniref:Sigma-70 family RNA polymerase sigma factor n=1 Tax=Ravibacter arvi TaxID=2051041 RepID=A0ABP8LTI0_9BACT